MEMSVVRARVTNPGESATRSAGMPHRKVAVAFLQCRHDMPFRFTGKLDKLTFPLEPQQPTA